MVRLGILLLTRRWGLIVLGAILIIAGLAWGLAGSHQVSYIKSNDNTNYRIGTGDQTNNVYIHPDGSDDYYVAFASDFAVSDNDINNSKAISFIARSDTSSLDPSLNASDGSTINDAHKIEQLVFYDSNGNVMNTYETSEYKSNPNGFYDSEWIKSIWLVIGGAVLLLLALFIRPRKRVATESFNLGAQGGVPPYQPPQPNSYPQPQQPNPYAQPQQPNPYAQPQPPNPYDQAYQGPQQYPPGAPSYPPTQYAPPPNNPYQQPPQG